MISARRNAKTIAHTVILGSILLLLFAFGGIEKAWGASYGYAGYYKSGSSYTVVLQSDDKSHAGYGTLAEAKEIKYSNFSFASSGRTIVAIKMYDAVKAPVNMTNWFSGLKDCTLIDLSKLDTSDVKDMSCLFLGCTGLTSIDLSSWNLSKVTNVDRLFSGCSSLSSVEFPQTSTSSLTSMYGTFWGCTQLANIDLSCFDTSQVTNMASLFYGCESLTTLDISKFNTANVSNMTSMFKQCRTLTKLDVSLMDTSSCTNMAHMFYDCDSVTSLDLSNFDTSKVTDMNCMFCNCDSLTQLSIASFDTSQVTKMGSMFGSCVKLAELDLSSFNTSNVTDMFSMFSSCKSLRALDLSSFNATKATDTSSMFYGCSQLTSLDLSSFNTTGVEKAYNMFSGCTALTGLDLSSFQVLSNGNFSNIFNGCEALTSISLSRTASTYLAPMLPSKTWVDEQGNTLTTADLAKGKSIICTTPGQPKCIFSSWVSDIPDATFKGTPVKPQPVVTHNGVPLVEGVDYSVTYQNNSGPGVGRAILTGINGYTGLIEKKFIILADPAGIEPGTPNEDVPSSGKTEEPATPDAPSFAAQPGTNLETSNSIPNQTLTPSAPGVSANIATQTLRVTSTEKSYGVAKTRAGKLKTAQSFQLKVSGDVPQPVFKKTGGSKWIMISPSGKATVKKGTPVGVYTIEVAVSSPSVTASIITHSKTGITATVKVTVGAQSLKLAKKSLRVSAGASTTVTVKSDSKKLKSAKNISTNKVAKKFRISKSGNRIKVRAPKNVKKGSYVVKVCVTAAKQTKKCAETSKIFSLKIKV